MCITGREELIECPHNYVEKEVYYLNEYRGICHNCGGPITFIDPFAAAYLTDDVIGIARVHVFVPLTPMICEKCKNAIDYIASYCDPSFVVYPNKISTNGE